MTVHRLRPAHSAAKLAELYPEPHDHRRYGDGHHLRVKMTREIVRWMVSKWELHSGADLSCGNGAILDGVGLVRTTLGDLAPGYDIEGPIEQTIEQIEPVDIFVCSETLEHLDDPPAVLAQIRQCTGRLVLTTPIDAWSDTNSEHYWAWDRRGVSGLLRDAGFDPIVFASLDTRPFGEPYHYGIWGCE